MSMHLVTGRAGSAHINSDMVGRFNAGVVGSDSYILDTQDNLACTVVDNNNITIETGDAIVQGRHVTNESPETLTIQSGGQNVSRYDLIVIRYTNSGGIESASLAVITGTPSASPTDPAYNNGSILDGETAVDIPLYRVVIDGLNIDHIDTLAETIGAKISPPVVLFEGEYAETYNAQINISETAANFARLTVQWVSSDGIFGSADIVDPNGKSFMAMAVNTINPGTQAYLKWKAYIINGTTIDTVNPSGTVRQRGQITLRDGGTTNVVVGDYIGITKVLGWRY